MRFLVSNCLSRKITTDKRNHQFNLVHFSNGGFPSPICKDIFQESFIFGAAPFLHFFRVSTSTQQLLFFEELLLGNSHFFAAVTFLEQLLFQSESFTKHPFQENGQYIRAVICLMKEWFRIKVSAEELLSRSNCFHTAPTFSDELLFGKS